MRYKLKYFYTYRQKEASEAEISFNARNDREAVSKTLRLIDRFDRKNKRLGGFETYEPMGLVRIVQEAILERTRKVRIPKRSS